MAPPRSCEDLFEPSKETTLGGLAHPQTATSTLGYLGFDPSPYTRCSLFFVERNNGGLLVDVSFIFGIKSGALIDVPVLPEC